MHYPCNKCSLNFDSGGGGGKLFWRPSQKSQMCLYLCSSAYYLSVQHMLSFDSAVPFFKVLSWKGARVENIQFRITRILSAVITYTFKAGNRPTLPAASATNKTLLTGRKSLNSLPASHKMSKIGQSYPEISSTWNHLMWKSNVICIWLFIASMGKEPGAPWHQCTSSFSRSIVSPSSGGQLLFCSWSIRKSTLCHTSSWSAGCRYS